MSFLQYWWWNKSFIMVMILNIIIVYNMNHNTKIPPPAMPRSLQKFCFWPHWDWYMFMVPSCGWFNHYKMIGYHSVFHGYWKTDNGLKDIHYHGIVRIFYQVGNCKQLSSQHVGCVENIKIWHLINNLIVIFIANGMENVGVKFQCHLTTFR